MADFNPDDYLASQDAGGFNPDTHLADIAANPSLSKVTGAPQSTADKLIGYGEGALSTLTGGVASLAGGMTYLGALARHAGDTDLAAREKAETERQLTYVPRTQSGQEVAGLVGKAASYLGEKQGKILGAGTTDLATRAGLPPEVAGFAGATAETLANIPQFLVGSELGRHFAALRGEDAGGSASAANTLKAAQDIGYVVPPSTSNPTLLNRVVEGTAGKLSTAQAASIKNQQVHNSLARQEFGLPEGTELSHDTMAEVRAVQSPAYKAVAAVPEIKFGDEYNKDLSALTSTADKITSVLPNYKATGAEHIQSLVDSLKPKDGVMDGETAVELSKSLRAEASGYETSASRTGDPQAKALGRAYRGAATAVENAVQSHLENIGEPELATNWDNARRTIAKTYSVEKALDGAGNVDATKLGKDLIKGKPLSGNLATMAEFANLFPKANNPKWSRESVPGMSPLDMVAGTGAAIGSGLLGHETLPSLAAGIAVPAARMTSRAALLSPLGQRLAIPGSQSPLAPVGFGTGQAAIAGAPEQRQ